MPDRLGALQDELLQHILGFLPAHEAVRTSVLAPRWRSLWKSVRRLHITYPVEDWDEDNGGERCLRDFVNPLFLLRGCASLEEVKFDYDSDLQEETNIWVRHALLCQAQLISVHSDRRITLEDPPLVSTHLRKLELNRVYLKDKFLDFACCPALEVLEMTECDIGTERILSPSIKLLRVESSYFNNGCRTRISVPSLIWLQLNHFKGRTPLLESMPLLETASVEASSVPWGHCVDRDYCVKRYYQNCGGICAACSGDDDLKGRCVLLGGLPCAVDLKLKAYCAAYVIFRRDVQWCPTFSKLKTLLLSDWCVAVDLFPLVCILKHSPVLENLTLHLRKGPAEFTMNIEGNDNSMIEAAALSERLKTIKIKCEDVDDRVCKVLKFLSTLGIEVTIKRTKGLRFVYQ